MGANSRTEGSNLRLRGSISGCAVGLPIFVCFGGAALAFADPTQPSSPTNIFGPASSPAKSIFGLSLFVLAVTGAIFLVVFALLLYSIVRFRKKRNDDGREPPQVYGSMPIEIAWTAAPSLVVFVLILLVGRVIWDVRPNPDRPPPGSKPPWIFPRVGFSVSAP